MVGLSRLPSEGLMKAASRPPSERTRIGGLSHGYSYLYDMAPDPFFLSDCPDYPDFCGQGVAHRILAVYFFWRCKQLCNNDLRLKKPIGTVLNYGAILCPDPQVAGAIGLGTIAGFWDFWRTISIFGGLFEAILWFWQGLSRTH